MNKLLKIIGEGFKFIAFFIIIIFSIELIKFVFISCILIWAYLMSIYPQHIEIISLVIKMNSYILLY